VSPDDKPQDLSRNESKVVFFFGFNEESGEGEIFCIDCCWFFEPFSVSLKDDDADFDTRCFDTAEGCSRSCFRSTWLASSVSLLIGSLWIGAGSRQLSRLRYFGAQYLAEISDYVASPLVY